MEAATSPAARSFDPAAAPYAAVVDAHHPTAQADWDRDDRRPTPSLWPDLSTATSVADLYESYIRLKEMSLAYSTHGLAARRRAPDCSRRS